MTKKNIEKFLIEKKGYLKKSAIEVAKAMWKLSPKHVHPKTKKELRKAIEEYCENDDRSNGNINDWDVSLITDMSELFCCCWDPDDCDEKIHHFNQSINNWNVSKVTKMSYMFYGCIEFNQPINNWNVSNVADMNGMFYCCYKFNQPINNWNVSNVTTMRSMFSYCKKFNQSLNNWNVLNVTNMHYMFNECNDLNKTYKEQFYMININKKNKYVLSELQENMPIIKIYYMTEDKEFIMKNINNYQKNEIQKFIKNKTENICEICYLHTDCVNNICAVCS